MKKRIISLALALLMLIAMVPAFATAEGNGATTFTVTGGTGFGGDTVSIKVNLSELTEDLMLTQFNLVFDSSRLQYVEGSFAKGAVNNFDTIDPVAVSNYPAKEGYSQIAINAFGSDTTTKTIAENGDIYTFEFKIKEDAIGTAEVFIDKNTAVFFTTSSQQLLNYSLNSGAIDIKVKAESITLTPSELNVTLGQQSALICEVLPVANTEKVTWTSSDPGVVGVEGGVITGNALGTATITATTESGLSASSSVTVVPANASMLKEPSVKLITDGSTVSKKVELVIPGPYPNKWTAYSNDHFLYVTAGRKYEVAKMANSATEVQELTIMCDPNQLQRGIYTGTVTIVCGDITERLLVYFELTRDVNYVVYWEDVFPENPYRENIAITGEATSCSYYGSVNEQNGGTGDNPNNAIDGCINYWPRWSTAEGEGTWADPEKGFEQTVHWWMLDLKSQRTFDKFIMYGSDMDWCFAKEFKILGSNDKDLPDDQWHEICYVEDTPQRYNTMDFDPVSFRYIKILFLESVQSHIYGNCARMAEFKVLTTKPYPEVTVESGPELVDMKVNSTEGIDALITAPTDAFQSIDTTIYITSLDMFSDEYAEAETKLTEKLGYAPIFTLNDIYAFDTVAQKKVELLNGRQLHMKISVPGGFDFEKIKVLKVLENGNFENVPLDIEAIAEDDFMEIYYMVFDTDFFGKYVFIEDKYNYFGGNNPISADSIDFGGLTTLVIMAGAALSFAIIKRAKENMA